MELRRRTSCAAADRAAGRGRAAPADGAAPARELQAADGAAPARELQAADGAAPLRTELRERAEPERERNVPCAAAAASSFTR